MRPLCLPTDLSATFEGRVATIAGWGATPDQETQFPGPGVSLQIPLQRANVTVRGPTYEDCGVLPDQELSANFNLC